MGSKKLVEAFTETLELKAQKSLLQLHHPE